MEGIFLMQRKILQNEKLIIRTIDSKIYTLISFKCKEVKCSDYSNNSQTKLHYKCFVKA